VQKFAHPIHELDGASHHSTNWFDLSLKVPVWARDFTSFFVPSGYDEAAYDGQQAAD